MTILAQVPSGRTEAGASIIPDSTAAGPHFSTEIEAGKVPHCGDPA